MTQNLPMSRHLRQQLYDHVANILSEEALTARQLADRLDVSRGRIYSILVSLRAEKVLEAVGYFTDDKDPTVYEIVWGLTYHGQFHAEQIGPPGAQCKACGRIFGPWSQ